MKNIVGSVYGSKVEATDMLDEVYMVVNDVSLTYRTCMQIMLDNSTLLHKALSLDTGCNSVLFRFMPDEVELVCTTCTDRKRSPYEYDEFRGGEPKYKHGYTVKNKVGFEGSDVVFLISVGFIADNFTMFQSATQIVEEEHPGTVRLKRSSLESLCRM